MNEKIKEKKAQMIETYAENQHRMLKTASLNDRAMIYHVWGEIWGEEKAKDAFYAHDVLIPWKEINERYSEESEES